MDRLLCQPFNLAGMALKNRIVVPPMVVRFATEDGHVTDRAIAYYETLARGGAGLIIHEATWIHPKGKILAYEPGISDDSYIPKFAELTRSVHRFGAKIGIQLAHGGRASLLPPGEAGIAPSPIGAPGYAVPREMTLADIKTMVKLFADAAARAKKAGFDGIEVHAAHNYLIDGFISAASNVRKDEYGGSLENRARFMVEIIKAVQHATGGGFPVWCRINGKEFGVPGGETLAEAIEVARIAEKAGAVAIHVTAFGPVSPVNLTTPVFTPAVIADLAAGIKAAVKVPVIAVGRMTPEAGEKLLSQGKADLIAFGRALFADPDLPGKVCAGRLEEIRPCILCLRCRDDMRSASPLGVRCSVNLAMGNESNTRITRAKKSKKVLVVGGGPAGMEAARVAALKGHRVSLWEAEPELGGQLKAASIAPYKDRIGAILPYFKAELKRLGVDVKTGTEATADKVRRFAPDSVVIATGVKPAVPEIPGLEKAQPAQAVDVLLGKAKVGDNVAIIGGELVACEVAELLAGKGKKVTMLRRGPEIAKKEVNALRSYLLERLKNAGVSMLTGVTYEKVTGNGIVISTKEGERKTIKADTIVLAAGAVSEQSLYNEIKDSMAEVYLVGDSVSPRKIGDAIAEGFKAGFSI